ncbi:MAG: hypothetical protein WCI18_14790 [Pseudomonadota bacterium]
MDEKKARLAEMDDALLGIVGDVCNSAVECAGKAAESILDVSSKFIDGHAQRALKDFRSIYFENSEIRHETEKINSGVDSMIDDLQAKLEAGDHLSGLSLAEDSENDELARNRMALSALQKRLEQIISLDDAIKQKLIPVLSSMQFEDMIRQRLNHVVAMWGIAIMAMHQNNSHDFTATAEAMAQCLTSKGERDIYYRRMLGIDPPESIADQAGILDILF